MPEIQDIITSIRVPQLIKDPIISKAKFFPRMGGFVMYSGGYSVAFPCDYNGEKWAFRCWHAAIGGLKERYEKFSDSQKQSNLPYFCKFEYVDQGIVVKGVTYPTTRMQWIEGENLKDYICKNRNNRQVLEQLSISFIKMCQDMHKHSLAHGDLQHGNIIVDKVGDLYLVDYDSFYCPELKGQPDIITGLKGYQHPARETNKSVSEKLDYFSELIIYLSILGIAHKPELVEKFQVDGSEHMLFTAEDFSHLRSSIIYQELHGLSFEIDLLLQILEEYLSKKSIDELEPFDVLLDRLTKDPEIHSLTISCGQKCILGKPVSLSWSVENYNKILLNGKDVTNQNSFVEKVQSSSQFVLEVWNGQKRTSKSIHVEAFESPVLSLSANKTKLHKGRNESVALTWDVQHASKITLLQDGQVVQEECKAQDSYKLKTKEDTTFALQVLALDDRTIEKKEVSIYVYPDASAQLEVDKEYVFPGIPFTLSWHTKNAKKVELNGKNVSAEGTQLLKEGVDKPTTYTLYVTDEFGTKEQSVSVKMLPIPQIESLKVPMPDIQQLVDLNINLNIPDFQVNVPAFDMKEIDLVHPEIYENGVDTSHLPSPPKIELVNLKTPSLWNKIEKKIMQLFKKKENEQ